MKNISLPLLANIIFKPMALIEPVQNARFVVQRHVLNHYKYYYTDRSDVEKVPLELYSDFGYVLKGNWYRQKSHNRKVIFLVHGYASVKLEMDYLSPFFFNMGFDVVSYNIYPYNNQNKLVTFGNYESQDLLKLCRGILEQQTYEVIGMFGHSLGAVTALHAANQDKVKVDFVIANSPFNKLDETLTSHILLHTKKIISKKQAFHLAQNIIQYAQEKWGKDTFPLETESTTMKLQMPVLYVHGEVDDMNPPYMTQELQAHTPHAYFTKLPHANHLDTFILTKKEIEMAIIDFLKTNNYYN